MRKWHHEELTKKWRSNGNTGKVWTMHFWSCYTTNFLPLSLFDAHHEVKSSHDMFFLSFFFFHPLPLFSLAALVHALHVRPSCYYKLLGGLTSLIANTDNGTILTQGLTFARVGGSEYERVSLPPQEIHFPKQMFPSVQI